MPGKFNPKDAGYVEVKDRIVAFYEKYPEGSLQSEIVELREDLVVVKGMAYRSPDDPMPGIGHSQMPIPGKTPYTVDSEIENAETSAWGRALAALGFEVHRSVASSDEVEMKIGRVSPSGGVTATPLGTSTAETESSAESTFAGAGAGDAPMTSSGVSKPVSSDKATNAQKARLMAKGRKLFGDEEGVRKFVYNAVGKNKASELTKKDMTVLFENMEVLKKIDKRIEELEAESESA